MISLYHCAGSRSLRCLWLLEELGADYELKAMPFPPRFKAPEFLAVNPLGSVPYLIDGDVEMDESCAILQYLAGRYGDGSLEIAADHPAYGHYLNALYFGECALAGPQAVALRYRFFLPADQRQPAVADDYQAMVNERLAVLNAQLQRVEGDFLCGDRFTLADISVGYALLLISHFKLDEAFSDEVRAYAQRLFSRPAFQRAAAL